MIASERICSNPALFALFKPDKVVRLAPLFDRSRPLRVLDVGCGNHSVRYLKTQFPRCQYTGVDRGVYNNTESDLALMDRFCRIDLENADFSPFPDGGYDLVVLAHVVEHLRHGRDVLLAAMTKVAPGGILYVAHPSAESVTFPHRKDTLNFYDDPTHVTVWSPHEAADLLNARGFKILESGRTRLARNLLLMPVKVTFSRYVGGVTGPMLWDLYGFEEYVVARRAGGGRNGPSGPDL